MVACVKAITVMSKIMTCSIRFITPFATRCCLKFPPWATQKAGIKENLELGVGCVNV